MLVIYAIVACILMAFAAQRFVTAATVISVNLGVPPLIVGLVLLGFATSFPEMLVSVVAASSGQPLLALGNALGSNIANIGLVVGVTAFIKPLIVHPKTLKRELVFLYISMVVAWLLIFQGNLGFVQASILFALMLLFLGGCFLLAAKVQNKKNASAAVLVQQQTDEMNTFSAIFWLIIGLILLLVSSHLLIYSATHIAEALGVSKLVIGLTVVALGTSLPELAVSIAAALKQQDDLVLGNVIGSNISNILCVFAIPGFIVSTELPKPIIWRDFPIMIFFTILLTVMLYHRHRLTRLKSIILLACFVVYEVTLYNQ